MPAVSVECETTISSVTIIESAVANNVSKAPGPDSIHDRVFKECSDNLAPGLSRLFQCSLDTGTLRDLRLNAHISCV